MEPGIGLRGGVTSQVVVVSKGRVTANEDVAMAWRSWSAGRWGRDGDTIAPSDSDSGGCGGGIQVVGGGGETDKDEAMPVLQAGCTAGEEGCSSSQIKTFQIWVRLCRCGDGSGVIKMWRFLGAAGKPEGGGGARPP